MIDERVDLPLLAAIAEARPDWSIVMIGPVAKLAPDELPRRTNLHYLGQKSYADLPAYLAACAVALLPFALNEATRYISPTKTPEYLAAGKPVVSTPVPDVVEPYGSRGLVAIREDAAGFVAAVADALDAPRPADWLARVDAFLSSSSWDRTWAEMARRIELSAQRASRDDARSTSGHAHVGAP